jgi:hypothetical protein
MIVKIKRRAKYNIKKNLILNLNMIKYLNMNNEELKNKQFIKMRDSGKFSRKFEGEHSYFIYIEKEPSISNLKIIVEDYDYIQPPTPRKPNYNILLHDS